MKKWQKWVLSVCAVLLVLAGGIAGWRYKNKNDQEKYLGHGFDYMNGYSSTDFTGYHVYDSDKLYKLDHDASLTLEEDYPVLDGAEACYPVYSALALAAYKDIDVIEKEYHDEAEKAWNEKGEMDEELLNVYFNNGKYVTFTNSSDAYYRLIDHEADMVFGAKPSAEQKEYAIDMKETILTTPIGKEAFIFFVEEDNPVDNLTSDQIRGIYHGDYRNWKELGGKNEKIVAFQRPENSGSQVCMHYFMGDVEMADPKIVEIINVGPMGGVVREVAQYYNEAGAIGYTFKYFLTGLNQEKHVKILSVDGVYPDTESIKNGTYPATVDLVCATLESNKKPNVQKMMNFILSDDGQEIIEQTGYAALTDRNVSPQKENEITEEGILYEGDGNILCVFEANNFGNFSFEIQQENYLYKGMMYPDLEEDSKEEKKEQYFGDILGEDAYCIFAYDPEEDVYIVIESNVDGVNTGTVFTRKDQK